MGRRKAQLITPKNAARVISVLSLLLDKHPVGWFVLTGSAEFPSDEEVAEMLCSGRGESVHVQNGNVTPEAQRYVEMLDSAHKFVSIIHDNGGSQALSQAVQTFRAISPDRYAMLKKIGTAGMPNAPTLEQVAGQYHIDRKTLSRWKEASVRDIAMLFCYGACQQ